MENRQLKFRAFDDGKMVYENNILHLSNEDNQILRLAKFWSNIRDDSFVMQFTGFKDKHGKEIYEGDILNVCNGSINGTLWMDKPYAVEYGLKGCEMCKFCWDKDGNSEMDSTHWCEIIGNICETPKLLTEREEK